MIRGFLSSQGTRWAAIWAVIGGVLGAVANHAGEQAELTEECPCFGAAGREDLVVPDATPRFPASLCSDRSCAEHDRSENPPDREHSGARNLDGEPPVGQRLWSSIAAPKLDPDRVGGSEIGRASCRERV